jgi:hypothetical protein
VFSCSAGVFIIFRGIVKLLYKHIEDYSHLEAKLDLGDGDCWVREAVDFSVMNEPNTDLTCYLCD